MLPFQEYIAASRWTKKKPFQRNQCVVDPSSFLRWSTSSALSAASILSVEVCFGVASSTIFRTAVCGTCKTEHDAAALDDLGHERAASDQGFAHGFEDAEAEEMATFAHCEFSWVTPQLDQH